MLTNLNDAMQRERLEDLDKRHLIHPWVDLGAVRAQKPLIIDHADGVYVYDGEGQKMIDGMGGMWCVNVGYGRDEIADAIAAQAKRMCYYSPFTKNSTEPAIEFAHRIAKYAPGDLNRVFFTTGGSTAVDSAVRFIHFYFSFIGQKNRRFVISREQAYHGSTFLTATLSGKPADKPHMRFADDLVHHLPAPNPYRRPAGMSIEAFADRCVADLEKKILELGAENVAAFIAEPLLASGGVIVPPPGYQRRTWEICRKYGVLYISDEVVTGFGRLGHVFASQPVFDIVPDVITAAKGLTSGYVPLGAFLVSDALYQKMLDVAGEGQMFANGFTYSSHPVACAAGLAALDILEREDICGHVREWGPYFHEELKKLSDLELVGDVRGSHFMVCVECVSDRQAKTPCPGDWNVAKRVFERCRERGLMIRPMGNLIVLSPPLTITKAQIDAAVAAMRGAIKDVQDDLAREGLWRGR
ncbi:MAG TPA: aminotransferase [Dongiaceae bacterium]|nr:aminotransferase [Dongiaceae bacterium]